MQCIDRVSLPHHFVRDGSKDPAKNQKLELITCQRNCLASVLKAKSWTDRFHKANEESLYSSSEFHYLLEFHLKDHKFCIFFYYSGLRKKGYIFCDYKNSVRVLENSSCNQRKNDSYLQMDAVSSWRICPVAGVCFQYYWCWCWFPDDSYSTTIFLLVFWVWGLPYKNHLWVKEGFPIRHKLSLHRCQDLLNLAFLALLKCD